MAEPQPFNILYIHSHDTGRYIQPYGHAIPTPNLQRLAEEGVLFRRAFCAAPTCSPSRAALLTGQSAHSSGMLGLAHRGFSLYDYGRHIVHTLRQAGYVSVLAGVQHVSGGNAAQIGYDRILGRANAEELAIEWLEAGPPQPFFLDVGFVETHRLGNQEGAFNPDGPLGDARYCQPPMPLPDTPAVRQDMADFKISAQRLDTKVGKVLEVLQRLGLAENTLVISTTDHGIAFPHMKCNLTDHGIGVSLIMRGPGGFSGGKVIDGMVSHIDVFPTLCELVGAEAPAWLEGRSFMPLVRGERQEVNEEIFAEVTYHAAYEPQRAVRTQRWKYIRQFSDRGRPVMPNCDDSLSKTVLLERGWRDRQVPREALYDLVYDPAETCNLAGESELQPVLEEMRGRLKRWMERTRDPLLQGPVPLPAGAVANDPNELSPRSKPRPG